MSHVTVGEPSEELTRYTDNLLHNRVRPPLHTLHALLLRLVYFTVKGGPGFHRRAIYLPMLIESSCKSFSYILWGETRGLEGGDWLGGGLRHSRDSWLGKSFLASTEILLIFLLRSGRGFSTMVRAYKITASSQVSPLQSVNTLKHRPVRCLAA